MLIRLTHMNPKNLYEVVNEDNQGLLLPIQFPKDREIYYVQNQIPNRIQI